MGVRILTLVLSLLAAPAAALTARAQQGALDDGDTDSVAPHSQKVLFHHMHKAGGTTICQLATLNGEKVPTGKDGAYSNCNDLPDEDPDNMPNGLPPPMSCDERRSHAATFMGQERWFDDNGLCDGVIYGISLREPLSRIRANLKFHNLHWYKGMPTPDDIMTFVQNGAWHFPSNALVHMSTATHDNFYVRSLLGRTVYWLPAGAITREHLELAKARLRNFSIVLVLEDFKNHSVQLRAQLGWRTLEVDCASPTKAMVTVKWLNQTLCGGSAGKSAGGEHDKMFNDAQMERLAKLNALDTELYAYAKEVALERSTAAQASHMLLMERDSPQLHGDGGAKIPADLSL